MLGRCCFAPKSSVQPTLAFCSGPTSEPASAQQWWNNVSNVARSWKTAANQHRNCSYPTLDCKLQGTTSDPASRQQWRNNVSNVGKVVKLQAEYCCQRCQSRQTAASLHWNLRRANRGGIMLPTMAQSRKTATSQHRKLRGPICCGTASH